MTDQTTNPGAPGSTAPSASHGGTTTEDKARTEAERAADEARTRGQAIGEEARQEASRLASSAQSFAEDKAEEYKGQAASEMNRMATALRDAGSDLREGSPQERAISSMADNLADAADAFANRDLGSLMADASAFARRNPTAFLGGAALLGFAAARFAKASQRDSYQSYDSGGYRGYQEPLPASSSPVAATSPSYGTSGSASYAGSTGATTGATGGTTSTASSMGTGTTAGTGVGSATTGTTGAGSAVSGTGSTPTGGSTGSSSTDTKSGTPAVHTSEDD